MCLTWSPPERNSGDDRFSSSELSVKGGICGKSTQLKLGQAGRRGLNYSGESRREEFLVKSSSSTCEGRKAGAIPSHWKTCK